MIVDEKKTNPNIAKLQSYFRDKTSRYFEKNGAPKKEYFEKIKCCNCGSDSYANEFTADKFRHVRCGSCGMVYVNPRFREEIAHNLYSEADYTEFFKIKLIPSIDYRRNVLAKNKHRQIMEYFKAPGRALDIGCGLGEVLSVFKEEGWDCTGIEFNKFAADYASKKFGLRIMNKSVFDIGASKKTRYDLIMMWGVLEHFYDPAKILRKIRTMLAPDGLLVLEVPSADSVLVRFVEMTGRPVDRIVEGDRHIMLFSLKAFKGITGKCGFSPVKIVSNGLDISTISRLYMDDFLTKEGAGRLQAVLDESLQGDLLRGFFKKSLKANVMLKTEKINTNLHIVGGGYLFAGADAQVKEYRKKWEEYPRNFYVSPFPLFIDIESTSLCNLSCTFCYNRQRINGGMIKFDLVRKIIDEGADNGLCGVKFNFRGEPLLHPQIHEFVKYAKAKGLVDVYFNTNAAKLTPEMSLKLIEARLDRITISFEGYTKEVYEKYRIGADFGTVIRNIDSLIKLRKKAGVNYPKIRVQSVSVPELAGHEKDYGKYWIGAGADQAACVDFQDRKFHKGRISKWVCPQPWQRACVSWNGATSVCSQDESDAQIVGNAADTPIMELWNSPAANRLRELQKNGLAHLSLVCLTCPFRNTEVEKTSVGECE